MQLSNWSHDQNIDKHISYECSYKDQRTLMHLTLINYDWRRFYFTSCPLLCTRIQIENEKDWQGDLKRNYFYQHKHYRHYANKNNLIVQNNWIWKTFKYAKTISILFAFILSFTCPVGKMGTQKNNSYPLCIIAWIIWLCALFLLFLFHFSEFLYLLHMNIWNNAHILFDESHVLVEESYMVAFQKQ